MSSTVSASKPSTPPPPPPLGQKLQAKVYELRFHALVVFLSSAALLFLVRAGSGVASVVSFFRPLLLSTAFFLAAVVVLRMISSPSGADDVEKTSADLMDYVAGAPGDGGDGGEEREGRRGDEEHRKSQ